MNDQTTRTRHTGRTDRASTQRERQATQSAYREGRKMTKNTILIREDAYNHFLYTSSVKEALQDLLHDFDHDVIDGNEFIEEVRNILDNEGED